MAAPSSCPSRGSFSKTWARLIMPASRRTTRVGIVGGGCAALATALELTRPEQEGRYEVTVYQLGWRLGGKGASGRGVSGRIEEHGLHVWMGWYENAFRLLRECYDELGRDWRSAFEPASVIAITDRTSDGRWVPWSRLFPPTSGLPGDPLSPGEARWSIPHYLLRTASLLRTLVAELEPGSGPGLAQAGVPPAREDVLRGLARL